TEQHESETQAERPEPVPLDEYRADMLRARKKSLKKPGIYLDTSPTGAGKSYADIQAIAGGQHLASLTIVPTHLNCRQQDAEMSTLNLKGVAFPELNEETCKRFDEALEVTKRGLAVPAALCGSCQHRKRCPYRKGYAAAQN